MDNGIIITGNMVNGQVVSADITKEVIVSGSIGTGGIGPKGDTGDTGGAGPPGPPGPPGNLSTYFNVIDSGATGDGTTDDTAAIQQAIASANVEGGTVFFPPGTYKITSALIVYTGVSFLGTGSEASIINQTSTSSDGIDGVDIASVGIEGLLIQGPSSGTGVGINFSWSSAGNVPFLDFRDLKVHDFGSDGIAIETPIVSTFSNVVSQGNGGYGFNWYHAGTSCTFISCWARDNTFAGYHFYQSVYVNLSGCAADGNGVGYLIESAQSIGFFACGAESQVVGSGSWDGTGFKISNSSVIGLHDVWLAGNPAIGIWVTDGSIATEIFGAADNSPGGGATNFVKTDVSTNTTLSDVHNTTANSYSPGTVTVLNDGANGMLTKQMTVKDASGSMIMTATSDGAGGQYSLQADTTGILDIFGQGGQTLNVNVLDGYLQLSALTATTVPYLDTNKRFVSSAVTPTELGYVSGVTSAIQTQLGTKAPLASPSFTTPSLGVATATSINKLTLTQPATGSTLTLVDGSSLITAGAFALTLTTTATSNVTFPTGSSTMVAVNATQTLTAKTITGLKLTAGTTAVAPLTIASGTNLSAAVSGSIEYDGSALTYTDSTPTRQTLVTTGKTATLSNKTITGLILTAGSTTVAPLTFSGVGALLTTAVANSVEWDGTNLYYTTSGPTRHTIVSLDQTQTLTNKTLTSPVLTSPTSNTLLTANTQISLVGASGTLAFTAASDGGDYNIFSANGNQTLALYGSGGNTLNLHLLDGLASFDGGTSTSGTATASNPTFVSGTALQVNTTQDTMLYIEVKVAQAMVISIGPTSTPATTLFTSITAALGMIGGIRVPKGWYVQITSTIVNLNITAITC